MDPQQDRAATRVDIKTLLRFPQGTDHAMLRIYLDYNDILVRKGIGSFNIWMKRANYLYAMERLEESVVAIDMALAHDRENSEALFLRGVCLQLLALQESKDGFAGPLGETPTRLLTQAKNCFERVIAVNPLDDEAATYLTNVRCLLYSPGGTTGSGDLSGTKPDTTPAGLGHPHSHMPKVAPTGAPVESPARGDSGQDDADDDGEPMGMVV